MSETMERPEFVHNMGGLITGEIEYSQPFTFEFVYDDNRRNVFKHIMGFTVMRTGCYVLLDQAGVAYVVRPNYDYVIETPEVQREQDPVRHRRQRQHRHRPDVQAAALGRSGAEGDDRYRS